jgi:transposase InsO family protein
MATAQENPTNPIAEHSRKAASWAIQAPRRRDETLARRHAVRVCDELAARGYRRYAVVRRLSVSCRTLSRWRHACHDQCSCSPRGRPCKESPTAQRQEVLDWLNREGCHLGSPALRAAFPSLPRCELLELQCLWRQAYRATHRCSVEQLNWHPPGCVWAMDHTQPPEPIEGVYPSILCVRDLASGMQLAWQPVRDETAKTTIALVESLIAEHGPPLVIKSDNGPAFKDHDFAALLLRHRVVPLPSPPRTPRYNGSCEATNGHGKVRTQHFADRDHQGSWTRAAVSAAQRQANELLRPDGHLGPSPSQRWAARTPITDQQRNALAQTITEHRQRLLPVTTNREVATVKYQRRVYRAAVRRALIDLGLLSITRRSIIPPFKLQKRAKIS